MNPATWSQLPENKSSMPHLTRRKFTRMALAALPTAGLLSVTNPLHAAGAPKLRPGGSPGPANGFRQDVFAHGAKGDGATLDTGALQAAIDACHAAGGGQVYLRGGRFLSGTLYLKSNVSLHIEAGATLLGSGNPDDYPRSGSKYPGYDGELFTGKALIYAESATAISIGGSSFQPWRERRGRRPGPVLQLAAPHHQLRPVRACPRPRREAD
jgi:hypothetical protein